MSTGGEEALGRRASTKDCSLECTKISKSVFGSKIGARRSLGLVLPLRPYRPTENNATVKATVFDYPIKKGSVRNNLLYKRCVI